MSRAREAESAYRNAFEEFSRKVQEVQALTARAGTDPKQVETALVQLERSHVAYIERRNQWVQHLLPSSSQELLRPGTTPQHDHDDCVRAIAQVLWESQGRPEGTCDEDWRRAEEIVRMAAQAA